MVLPLPGILQQTRAEKLKLEAETAAAGPRSCGCWSHHLGDSPECHQFAYF